jgi:hypothetical protein
VIVGRSTRRALAVLSLLGWVCVASPSERQSAFTLRLGAVGGLPVVRQDAEPETGQSSESATGPGGIPTGPDGLPDPGFWRYDEDGHARDWLDKPPIDPSDLRARLPAYRDVLADHGIQLDLESREIAVRGATIHDATSLAYPIEYLVVTDLGRTHEALVLVRAQPSVINACLAALSLEPGGPTNYEAKDPPPPDADVMAGRVSPWLVHAPYGPLIDISISWVDDDGRSHEESLERLLYDARTDKQLENLGWIYTGSTYASYRQGTGRKRWFKADLEGDVVAIYLAGHQACLFERNSLDGLLDGYYFPDPVLAPPRNTPITLTFRATGLVVEKQPPDEGPLQEPTSQEPEEPGSAGTGGADSPDEDAGSGDARSPLDDSGC